MLSFTLFGDTENMACGVKVENFGVAGRYVWGGQIGRSD